MRRDNTTPKDAARLYFVAAGKSEPERESGGSGRFGILSAENCAIIERYLPLYAA